MERRKKNKQVTVEKLEVELHDAISERKKLEHTLQEHLEESTTVRNEIAEIKKKVDYDGGLVYKCDLAEFNKKNESEHKEIMKKLNEIYPKVKEEMKVADAYKTIGESWGKSAVSSSFWIKFVIGIGAIVGLIMLAVEEMKRLIK